MSTQTLTVIKSGTGTGTVTSNLNGIDCGSTCSYQFISGSNVTLTSTPDDTSVFSGWSGDVTNNNPTITVTMDSDKSIIATFNVKKNAGYVVSGYTTDSKYPSSYTDNLQFIDTSVETLSQSATPYSACNSTTTGYFGDEYNRLLFDKLLFKFRNKTQSTSDDTDFYIGFTLFIIFLFIIIIMIIISYIVQ
jgi:hypothetical protein